MQYVLGIDFGGGASKATLLGEDGRVAAESVCEYPTHYPKPGWAEQDPEDWVRATLQNIAAVLEKSGVSPKDVAALSLDAATHTAVLLDDQSRVLRPAVYWTDTRCAREAAWLREENGGAIERLTLHRPDTIWTLPQLLWVRNNEPELWKRVRKIVFAKDYVRRFFTGDHVTDNIEAEGSMLFDASARRWSPELCALLGIDSGVLPKLVRPIDLAGTVGPQAARLTGLREGTPVACGTTDTAMEVYACGAVSRGQTTVKLATAGRICVVTDRPCPDRNLVNYSHVVPGLYYPGTATKSCALSYRWFRDTFGEDYAQLDRRASRAPLGADGLLFHPYLNGELTPYGNANLCASFVGVRACHTKEHFARAVLEGVALSLLDCKTALGELRIPVGSEAVILGGGGRSPLWRQIVSDALGMTLIERDHTDSSFGSAMLAGVAAGVFPSLERAPALCGREVSRTRPDAQRTREYGRLFGVYRAVQRALEPIYNEAAR